MLKQHKILIGSIVWIGIYFLLIAGLLDDSAVRQMIGPISVAIAAIGVSFWLFRQYWLLTTQNRYFWLLLSFGMMLFGLTNLYDVISFTVQSTDQFTLATNWLWAFSYLVFFIALIYKLLILTSYYTSQQLVFNILVFLTFVLALGLHFIIMPLFDLSQQSIGFDSIEIIYPLLDLSILVTAFILLNLTWQTENVKWYSMFGLLILILGDLLYFYFVTLEGFIETIYIQPLWLLGVVLIGVSGFYARDHEGVHLSQHGHQFSLQQEILSYVVIFILIMFVFYSYGWELNSLSLGLAFILVITIIRNIFLIRQKLRLVAQYQYLAYHDYLTGLRNRSKFNKDLTQLVKQAEQKGERMGLIMIDLDNFKPVNDDFGHQIGDALLQRVVKRLTQGLRGDQGILYRLGGDEFIVLVPRLENDVDHLVGEILSQFDAPFDLGETELQMTPSIGVSIYPDDGEYGDLLLQLADTAMYQVKRDGKNNY
ncbi:diguanylate cyclase domain-containing protein [Alkalibacillus sp. S2W]|uniref:diguanylate cyclase domain-containing protein n=1 Tax=Alkalibacillus sp. S2W TaxID=3386553 RepID=UPI00398CC43B